jgi:serine/threonine protein phosphatase PrpC
MNQFVLDVAGLSDRGVKRDHNEDAWAGPHPSLTREQLGKKGQLYVVADGVGGHQAGDVASLMAVEIIQQQYYADPSATVVASLKAAIQSANDQIVREATARLARRGMSTTVTAAVVRDDQLIVANVGDSRTYLIHNGQARQLTDDHTWVEEQVRVGLISRTEAAKHPQRNIITRSLGSDRTLDIDIFEAKLDPGHSILLCSDGLSNLISKQEIGNIVNKGWLAEEAVNELIELAIKRAAPDNVTAVLINIVRSK